MTDHEFILDFIKRQSLAVISTINQEGGPESAVIGFAETAQLELIFGTYNSSRKYQNLKNNSQVAVVIGWSEGATVQYEGLAEELAGSEADEAKKIYFAKNPAAKNYANHPEERYFKITPCWIRYTDLKVDPWKIIELTIPNSERH